VAGVAATSWRVFLDGLGDEGRVGVTQCEGRPRTLALRPRRHVRVQALRRFKSRRHRRLRTRFIWTGLSGFPNEILLLCVPGDGVHRVLDPALVRSVVRHDQRLGCNGAVSLQVRAQNYVL
jgi:hypothetical protein